MKSLITCNKITYNTSLKRARKPITSETTNIWWTYPRKWLLNQNKETKAVKNWTITTDTNPWCRHRKKEQRDWK